MIIQLFIGCLTLTLKKSNLLLCNININLEELENPKKLIHSSLINNKNIKKNIILIVKNLLLLFI